ncbi:MAG TPA: chromate transporter [Planctomycetota bacterium]|nr:chromate transporter [Planctomycetota bacterium]
MIYWKLFISFLTVGCFSFGGAYAAIPLIQETVEAYEFMHADELAYMIAISESTPGPIMINLATYIGTEQGGILGAIIATFAVVLPAFIIIILITTILQNLLQIQYVRNFLTGVIPTIMGIIIATGFIMTYKNSKQYIIKTQNYTPIYLIAILLCIMFIYKKYKHKNISPIQLILISAFLGIILF